MLLGLVAVPYLLNRIGVERFGILTLIWALIGYFSIFDFGLGRALTQKVAAIRGGESRDSIAAATKSGLKLMSITGCVGSAVVLAFFGIGGVEWLGIRGALVEETQDAVYIAAIGIPAATMTSGLKGILEGYEKFKAVNILKLLLGASNFLIPMAIVQYWGTELQLIVVGLVASRLIIMLLHILPVIRQVNFHVGHDLSHSDHIAQHLIKFGAWMTLSNLISPLMVISDRFVISHFLGGAEVAYYTVPHDFLLRALVVPAAITTTAFPVFSHMINSNVGNAVKIYKKCIYSILGLLALLALFVLLFGHWALALWLGDAFADQSYQIATLLAIGVMFNGIAQVPHAVLQAAGDVRRTSIIHMGEFILYMPMLVVSVKIWGITGAAIVWMGRAAVDFLMLSWYARNKLEA